MINHCYASKLAAIVPKESFFFVHLSIHMLICTSHFREHVVSGMAKTKSLCFMPCGLKGELIMGKVHCDPIKCYFGGK